MEKNQFRQLVQNYTALTGEEAQALLKLQQEFPFSQVIQSMAARAAHDQEMEKNERYLHLSAIYSTDRNILKSIMNAPAMERSLEQPEIAAPKKEVESPSTSNDLIKVNDDLTGDKLFDEVMKDIAKLQKLKHKFEVTAEKVSKAAEKQAGSTAHKTEKKVVKPKDVSTPEGIIEEIKSSKKRLKTDDPKQKEQIEIIDQFIKTQPSIGKVKPTAPTQDAADLAENSILFGENIISETLVEILLKQGKKEKALEVLKKLIWKFPQKKTYFAARIEELKK